MSKVKLLTQALQGAGNLRFRDFVRLVEAYGFHLARTRGSHHIFAHPGIPELLNLQEVDGKAKPYQVRQFLKLVEKYNMVLGAG